MILTDNLAFFTPNVNYLKYSCREGAKFYLLKHSPAHSSSVRQLLIANILPEDEKLKVYIISDYPYKFKIDKLIDASEFCPEFMGDRP